MSRLAFAALVGALATTVGAQPGPTGVVFDDFDYASAAWVEDDGLDSLRNAGSVFGWNVWERALDGSAPPYRDRLWYRGFALWEPRYSRPDLVQVTEGDRHPSTVHGALLLLAAAGYTGTAPGQADPEILAGLTARHGTWAARINFSDLDDVRGLMQSFWTLSPYVAVVRREDGALAKAWSEIDHEFNNWFHTLWLRDPTDGGGIAGRYVSDQGSVHDATGYLEAGRVELMPMHGSGVADDPPQPPYHCLLTRNNDALPLRLGPSSCAALIAGDYPRLVYGFPALDRDIAVDVLIRNALDHVFFELRAEWQAAAPDGNGTDRYRLHMASDRYAGDGATPLPSQRLSAHFSQYVTGGTVEDVAFGSRPLMRSHPMAVDWFYYSPDATLDLAAIAGHVEEIRARGVRRLNTVGRPLHRPYTRPGGIAEWPHMAADHEGAVYLEGPETVRPGTRAVFVGHYADRWGELRLVWETRRHDRSGTASTWAVVAEDAWFRQAVPFPEASVPAFYVRLQAGEYPMWGDWSRPPTRYVGRTLTYVWDEQARTYRLAP